MSDDDRALGLLYRDALFNDVMPFWERHSIDHECGGYLTCLDQKGEVFDMDKFVWLPNICCRVTQITECESE